MASWRVIFRQIVILLPVYINTLLINGCPEGWMANAVYFFLQNDAEIPATFYQCTWMTSLTEIGRFSFAIPCGLIIDKYGRKKLMIFVSILNLLPWAALSMTKSITMIYIARFIMGVNNALLNTAGIIAIGETASPEIRGKLIVVRQIFVTLGVLFPCLTTIIFSSYEILNRSICIFSILGFISVFWLHETPHHLIRSSKYDQAKRNLLRARPDYQQYQINREFEKLKEYIDTEKKLKQETNWLQFIRTKSVRNPLLTGLSLVLFQSLIGSYVIAAYITLVIPSNAQIDKKFYPLIMTVATLLSRFCTALYIERFPRRTLCMFIGLIIGVTQLSNALNHYLYSIQNWQQCMWTFAIGNILVKIYVSSCLVPLTNTIKSEIFPQMVKGFGGSLCMLGASFGDFTGYQFFEIVRHMGLHYLYIFYALSSFALVLIVYYRLPEGRAKTLVDIQNVYYTKVAKESNLEST